MNLIKAAELLKGAPEDTLKRYLANPNGEFPEYLVASEIARRDDMRKRYASEMSGKPPKTSIIEELLQRDSAAMRAPAPEAVQQPLVQPEVPQAQGLGSVPPPQDMQMSAPPMLAAAQQPEQAPQQFYDGGIVALAEGGDVGQSSDMGDEFVRYMNADVSGGEGGSNIHIGPRFPIGAGRLEVDANLMNKAGYRGPVTIDPMADSIPDFNPRGYRQTSGRVGAAYPVGEGMLSAGVSGLANKQQTGVTGVDVGYEDALNRARLNIARGQLGGEYRRQISPDESLGVVGSYSPNAKDVELQYARRLGPDSEFNVAGGYGPQGGRGSFNFVRRFANGGGIDESAYDVTPNTIAVPEVKDLSFYLNQAQQGAGESGVQDYKNVLQQERERLAAKQKNYLPDFLISAGLGMAASKSPRLLQAAAEGAQQGFAYHLKSKEADEQANRNLVDSEFKFKQAERAERLGLFSLSNQLYSQAEARKNAALDYNMKAQQAATTAAHYRDWAKTTAAQTAATAAHQRVQETIARESLESTKAARQEAAEGRKEDRRLKALQIRGALQKARNDFQGSLLLDKDYQYRVKQAQKTLRDPVELNTEIARIRNEKAKQAGITDLEEALAAYEK